MMLVYVFYRLIIFLGYPILLGGFKFGDDFLDISEVEPKYYACRADEDFILDDTNE